MKDLLITTRTVEEGNILPLLTTVEEACAILRCGRTLVFAMLKSGTLERRKLGNATRITMRSIQHLAGL